MLALALALALVLVLAPLGGRAAQVDAAAAAPIVVRDDRGTEHRFEAPPARLVSLLPSLTESVWALGGGARLVGVDRFSNWPAELQALPRLGGLEDARLEAIAALKPDLVLASTSARSLDRLEALGLRVLRLKSETHEDMRRTLALLASVLGQPARGAAVWGRLQAELDAAAARMPAALVGRRVYFEIGGGPYAAGHSSFIGQTLTRLGLLNVVPASLGPFPKLNPEFVVRARPQLVMGVRHEVAGMPARPGWAELPAVREHALCGFDAATYDTLVRPGPRLGEAAARIVDCLAALPAGEAPR